MGLAPTGKRRLVTAHTRIQTSGLSPRPPGRRTVHIAQPCCSKAGSLCLFAISMQASAISAADPKHDGIDLTPHL